MQLLRAFISVLLISTTFVALADTGPDALKILEAQKDLVTISQSARSKNKATQFDIEICPTNVCDLFESRNPTSLRALADYTYLYAVYVAQYVDFAASSQPGEYVRVHFVAEGIKKGYAEQVLARYHSVAGCSVVQDRTSCVAEIGKKLSIKRFTVRYDEGARTVTSAED